MKRSGDDSVRAYMVWLGSLALGFAIGRLISEGIGSVWAPRDVSVFAWTVKRLSSNDNSVQEIAKLLTLTYGSAVVSGISAAAIATWGRRYGVESPLALIGALASAGHVLVVSPLIEVVGTIWGVTLSLLAIVIAALFGWLLARTIGHPPAGRHWPDPGYKTNSGDL